VPAEFVAEGLLAALDVDGLRGRRVLIPRAEVAREVLPDTLRAAGAEVDVVSAYRTVGPAVDPAVRARVAAGEADLITFTASSTVTHFCRLFDAPTLAALQARTQAACIGPITAETARQAGFRVAVEAERYTMGGLVDALAAWGAAAAG
ncbi:MAG: uroporphyrinogen-III synthase, partial [Myxococcales bacterium]|nr:uroporphyrinogen-III synthase [Myxococcales bacterium]